LVLRTLGTDHVVEAGGNVSLPLLVGVLIDERRLLGVLTRADHRVLERGPRAGRERVSGVTKVVEAEAVRETGGGTGPTPLPAEGSAPKWSPLLADEHQPVIPLLREPGEVLLHLLVKKGREDDGTDTRVGLGLTRSPLAVRALRFGDADADHEVVGVYVPATEAGQFLGPHWAIRTEVDHEAPADADGVGEGVDLGDSGDTTFGG
jgi:hypothetical protein